MAKHYGKAPIVEAIFDLRVEPRPNASPVDIAIGFTEYQDRFPKRQDLTITPSIQLTGILGSVPKISTSNELVGFRYESNDKKTVLQLQKNGFSFSLFPPYESWEHFTDLVRPLWETYRNIWKPQRIVRAALRYVNLIPISDTMDLSEVFTTFRNPLADDPDDSLLPVEIEGFLLNYTLIQNDIENGKAVINIMPGRVSNNNGIILDIDLFQQPISWNPDDDINLWERMGRLRGRKNELFESTLTKRIKEQFQ